MSAGKSIAPSGAQNSCQLTGWASPDLTAKSPDELPGRAFPPATLLMRASRAVSYLADPRPPPPQITGKRLGAFKEALPREPGANPSSNFYHEAYRQWFTKPARLAGGESGGFLFNPNVVERVHTLSVLKADS